MYSMVDGRIMTPTVVVEVDQNKWRDGTDPVKAPIF